MQMNLDWMQLDTLCFRNYGPDNYVFVSRIIGAIIWCVDLWCKQNVPRDDGSFTRHQPCNNQTALYVHHFCPEKKKKNCCVKLQSFIQHRILPERTDFRSCVKVEVAVLGSPS